MNIMKLIPSQDIAKTRWTFSDRDQAAILFNLTGLTLTEKTAYLQELGSQTKDQVLAKEIEERLEADAEIKTVFFRHAPGTFYMVTADACDEIPLGYYTGVEDAVQRGKQEGGAFEVYKYHLIGMPDTPPVWGRGHWNPYFLKTERSQEEPKLPDDDRDDCWLGCAGFNEQGELCSISSREALSIGETAWVELAFSPQRFEHTYVKLPNPFELGDIVQVVAGSMKGRRGVVETSREEWARFQVRVGEGLYADFSDVCITVEFPTKQGGFSHDHISLLYLDRCQLEESAPDYDILQAGSSMVQGQCSLDYFTYVCRKYRERS